VVQGGVSEDSFTGGLKMLAESIQSIYEARCSKITNLQLAVTGNPDNHDWVDRLHNSINPYLDGNCRLEIGYSLPSVKGKLKMGSQWRVQPRDELIGRLRDEFGNNSVTLIYD
jgi:DNA polymerase-3 subunit alpha